MDKDALLSFLLEVRDSLDEAIEYGRGNFSSEQIDSFYQALDKLDNVIIDYHMRMVRVKYSINGKQPVLCTHIGRI